MPDLEMRKWRINSLHFDMDNLKNGDNELKLGISFSTIMPKSNDVKDGRIQIELNAKTKDEKIFLKVVFDTLFVFLTEKKTPEEMESLLIHEGGPEAYEKLRSILNIFMDQAQTKRLVLPEYSELENR